MIKHYLMSGRVKTPVQIVRTQGEGLHSRSEFAYLNQQRHISYTLVIVCDIFGNAIILIKLKHERNIVLMIFDDDEFIRRKPNLDIHHGIYTPKKCCSWFHNDEVGGFWPYPMVTPFHRGFSKSVILKF